MILPHQPRHLLYPHCLNDTGTISIHLHNHNKTHSTLIDVWTLFIVNLIHHICAHTNPPQQTNVHTHGGHPQPSAFIKPSPVVNFLAPAQDPRAARQQKKVRSLKGEVMSLIINIPFKESRVHLTVLPIPPNYPGIVAITWSKATEENREPKETDREKKHFNNLPTRHPRHLLLSSCPALPFPGESCPVTVY